MALLITNIKELLQVRDTPTEKLSGNEMATLPTLNNAWLLMQNGTITGYGTMETCPADFSGEIIDATGKTVLPTWCDSHTHLVYAGNR